MHCNHKNKPESRKGDPGIVQTMILALQETAFRTVLLIPRGLQAMPLLCLPTYG